MNKSQLFFKEVVTSTPVRSRQYLFGTVGRNKPARPTPDPKIISYGSKQQGGREAGSLLQGGTWDWGRRSLTVGGNPRLSSHPKP